MYYITLESIIHLILNLLYKYDFSFQYLGLLQLFHIFCTTAQNQKEWRKEN